MFSHSRQSLPQDLETIASIRLECQKLSALVDEKDFKIERLQEQLMIGQNGTSNENELLSLKEQLKERDALIAKILSQAPQTTTTNVSAPSIQEMTPIMNGQQQIWNQYQ
jgi:hypothetical protein